MKILVIDDEALMRKTISGMLTRSGHETVCIESPLQALEVLNQDHFDAAVVDVNLADGADGIQLARDIRNLRPTIKAICISGNYSNKTRAETEGLTFIPKPFTRTELCAGILASFS